MIIVEGGDNCGKSTLVKQLIELDPSLRILHRDRYKPNAYETIATTHIRALIPPDYDCVRHGHSLADRFYASEIIYGELFRGGSRFSDYDAMTIRLLLHAYRAMVVWCNPPTDVVEATWSEREQLYRDCMRIHRAYRDRIRKLFVGFTVLEYDWTVHNAADIRGLIVNIHKSRSNSASIALGQLSYILGGTL
jgi:hypothetical protein